MLLHYSVKHSVLELNLREIHGPQKSGLLSESVFFFLYIISFWGLQGAHTWEELTCVESQGGDPINRFPLFVLMFFTKKYWNDMEIEEMGQKTTLYIRN